MPVAALAQAHVRAADGRQLRRAELPHPVLHGLADLARQTLQARLEPGCMRHVQRYRHWVPPRVAGRQGHAGPLQELGPHDSHREEACKQHGVGQRMCAHRLKDDVHDRVAFLQLAQGGDQRGGVRGREGV